MKHGMGSASYRDLFKEQTIAETVVYVKVEGVEYENIGSVAEEIKKLYLFVVMLELPRNNTLEDSTVWSVQFCSIEKQVEGKQKLKDIRSGYDTSNSGRWAPKDICQALKRTFKGKNDNVPVSVAKMLQKQLKYKSGEERDDLA